MRSLRLLRIFAVIAFAWIVLDPSLSFGDDATPVEQPLATRIQGIFGITPSGTDMLAPLAKVIDAYEKNPATAESELPSLVDALNQGCAPDIFTSVLLPNVHIDWDSAHNMKTPENWKYGTWNERRELISLLWAKSKSLKNTDGTRYGRAALLLAAHEDFINGWAAAAGLISNASKAGETGVNIGASAKQWTELVSMFTDYTRDGREFSENYYKALESFERCRKSKTMPAQDVQACIDSIKALKPFMLKFEWSRIYVTSHLRNLARSRNDVETVKQLDDLINQWRAETDNEFVKKWYTEAVERQWEPFQIYEHYEVLPNGTQREVN
jgi:hypothetical protein